MTKMAAIYARVSSDRQKENHTIASQLAALTEYAEAHSYQVPAEWRFQDEGYSGATLLRPGLEAVRDLAASGQLQAVLVYSPDRLSRKYAYQVLLAEELSRCGVELVFLQAPSGNTPEDQLLLQFQGMIAEYERAQIAERSRRGKRHRARQGSINVLSGSPYGYRYVRKSDTSAAYYEVIETEAAVVRRVYEMYTQQGLSINAIARRLNEELVPTRTGTTRWERSTVWGMLRNPAYRGRACYGKTELRPRQRITRALRKRGGLASRDSSNHERPRPEWIEIAVPALIREETFALAQEQLEQNKRHSPRRTIEPSLLQGMLVCERCGYALYRTSTRTSARQLYYYRCLGSDAYRHLRGAVCDNPPVRQDHLDAVVWKELVRLLEDPSVIQEELSRRVEAARKADPRKQHQESLHREQARLERSMDRLLNAYQEGLASLGQLRCRMPELRKQQQAVQTELQSLETTASDQAQRVRLVESLADFRSRLQMRAGTLEVIERQRILRLLVKEILVGKETLTIRHSIRVPTGDDKEKIDLTALSLAQEDAPRLQHAMSSYISWLAPQMPTLPELLRRTFQGTRRKATAGGEHPRVPEALAHLWLGAHCGLEFAEDMRAISHTEADECRNQWCEILLTLGESQSRLVEAEKPSHRFLAVLKTLVTQHRAVLLAKDSQVGHLREDLLGWYDSDYLYFIPHAACHLVSKFCRETNEPFPVREDRLRRDLERERVSEPDADRHTSTVRIGNRIHRVLRLRRDAVNALLEEEFETP